MSLRQVQTSSNYKDSLVGTFQKKKSITAKADFQMMCAIAEPFFRDCSDHVETGLLKEIYATSRPEVGNKFLLRKITQPPPPPLKKRKDYGLSILKTIANKFCRV